MRPSARELLRAAEVPAFLISDPLHVQYLTKVFFHGCCMLALPQRFILFVDDFSRPIADAEVSRSIAIRSVSSLNETLQKIRKCVFESEHITVERKARWKRLFPHTKFIQTDGVLQEFRRSKEADELRHLKR